MRIAEYCRAEDDFLLLPIEHLGPDGPDAGLAAFLLDTCEWSAARVALLGDALRLYWSRCHALAEKTRAWPRPRIRNIGIARDVASLRPYAQVLNTSTWSLYDSDFDVDTSNAEFIAYLLAIGDWMSVTGEVTQVPVLSAAWWIVADDEAAAAFSTAAKRSTRPDADALTAVARALPWLSNLRQRSLRPADAGDVVREIPASGLQVPKRHETKPPKLIKATQEAAIAAVEAHRRAWRSDSGGRAKATLLEWLQETPPAVIIAGADGEIVWDPQEPARLDALENVLTNADDVALESIHGDLALIDEHGRRFNAALSAPDSLPPCDDALAESGYAYMHPQRSVIAYNLMEPGMERLLGPALPYERAMLGARVLHEWGHLADEAGYMDCSVDDQRLAELQKTLADELGLAVAECDSRAAEATREDLQELAAGGDVGDALADLLLMRTPDYRANLIARAFMSEAERETYVRHNIRTLRGEYTTPQLWRAIVRYLYEYQYLLPGLALTSIEDPFRFFAVSTGFGGEFIDEGVVSEERFLGITAALTALFSTYRVDVEKIRV